MYLLNLLAVFPKECEKTFLGLKPWYHYLEGDKATCEVKNFNVLPPNSDLPLIFLAIIDDLLRIAGMVAVAFVIVGAINLITSDGAPDKAAKARETVINALLGLAIVLVSVAFVTFLGNRLAGTT